MLEILRRLFCAEIRKNPKADSHDILRVWIRLNLRGHASKSGVVVLSADEAQFI